MRAMARLTQDEMQRRYKGGIELAFYGEDDA
jgi:hypothetical protein